ncbi:MAG: hypothetical protein CEO40_149 [Parcubacteria group bacterium LiPW_72]|nr:MAG: hypothetical protein CEO40_149 [Parcubacteria group bacterium LiPW_72]
MKTEEEIERKLKELGWIKERGGPVGLFVREAPIVRIPLVQKTPKEPHKKNSILRALVQLFPKILKSRRLTLLLFFI